MSLKRSSESPLDGPTLVEGDPSLEYKYIFGKMGNNGFLYIDCYSYAFRMDGGPRDGEIITLSSYIKGKPVSGTYGDHGTPHRFLVDGVLIESENVRFDGRLPNNVWFADHHDVYKGEGLPSGKEVKILKEDDDRVHFLSAKSGRIVSRETYNMEVEEYKQLEVSDRALFDRVKYWLPGSCHPTIIEFRKRNGGKFGGVCWCGVVTTERRIRKKTSRNFGATFYGCSLFPNGCGYYKGGRGHSRGSNFNRGGYGNFFF